jgi:putative transposase
MHADPPKGTEQMEGLKAKDPAEEVAIFRREIIGNLTRREFSRGELRAELQRLSKERFRAPGASNTRTFSIPTLERWYYDLKKGGLEALCPSPRCDRGRGRDLTPEQRDLLLDIRREHRSASVALIVRTLVNDGRLQAGAVSDSTVRRLYAEHGLDRVPLRDGTSSHTRLRWQAERPGALWQGDVCYGPAILIAGVSRPVRIHALIDDASRHVIAIEAHHTEREADMLAVMVASVRKHGAPDALYLDNGSTYRGDLLRIACARLAITLLHPRPHDPQARGKIERFWRTLRQGCLDFVGALTSLHDLNVRLWAWVDQHYHKSPHASLMGKSPGEVYKATPRPLDSIAEQKLRDALTARVRRRVRRDTTVTVDGRDWELNQGFLAGRLVSVAHCLVDPNESPWVEHDGKRFALHPVDPVANAHRKRPPRRARVDSSRSAPVAFDPARVLLDRAIGRPVTRRSQSSNRKANKT